MLPVIDGQCWLSVQDVADQVHLSAGDCFLLPTGRTFSLATDPSGAPVDFETFLAALRSGRTSVQEGDTGCLLAGGHFLLGGEPADILLGLLPPIVHLRTDAEKAAMRWWRDELREPQLGGSLVVQQLAYMMLVQALRVHLTEASRGGVGWLYALTDPQMKKAIACMHGNLADPWTVSRLAECVGISRSIFALKFREKVGATPMEYLTRSRMLLAGDRLTTSGDSIMSIASSLGYESESAFGKAFNGLSVVLRGNTASKQEDHARRRSRPVDGSSAGGSWLPVGQACMLGTRFTHLRGSPASSHSSISIFPCG